MAASEGDRHFMERLATESLSAEQRSIRIEKWRESIDSIVLSRSMLSGYPLAASKQVAAEAASSVNSKVAPPEDPLLADIQETEAEIHSIHRAILTTRSTPEQRATQIEQFLELNRETFAQLQQMKRRAGARSSPEDRSSPGSSTMIIPMSVPMSEEASHLKAEIDRVMHDLSLVSPEARVQYLETHAATLRAMGEKISKSFTSAASPSKNPNTTAAP